MQLRFSFRAVVIPGLLALLASGCTTGLGPKAVRSERPDYNEQIARSADAEMLLNLVRLRYNDTPLFLELGPVLAQYNYDSAFTAGGEMLGSSSGGATVGTTLGYSEHPTITYTPFSGDEFATRMLTPIPLNSFMLFSQTGWSDERLLLVAAQRVNDLFNAPTATGPTPEHKPDYERFADFATRLHRLQSARLVGLNWETKEHESDRPGRNPHFWVHEPADPNSPLAADVVAIRRELDLAPGRDDFNLTSFPFKRQPDEVGLRCRSMLSVLYFLSQSVQPPAPHIQAGLVTTTKDDDGQPFDWSKVLGDIMTIHSQKERPLQAHVAVAHRGWWFYIADDDQSSKSTFSLLHLLFALQSATSKGKSPVLTLPVGR
ncbi:MAG: hypothetical protein HYR72_15315 [Deltaproteobacteria bacterium]|nr:hypothetical protein [Deltaproteobacteria bacterium]MBI3390170.1 hypothetical protein [Deltaproteobacteria bacterium]